MWRLLNDSGCHKILGIDIEKYSMPVFTAPNNVEALVWNEIRIGSLLWAENS